MVHRLIWILLAILKFYITGSKSIVLKLKSTWVARKNRLALTKFRKKRFYINVASTKFTLGSKFYSIAKLWNSSEIIWDVCLLSTLCQKIIASWKSTIHKSFKFKFEKVVLYINFSVKLLFSHNKNLKNADFKRLKLMFSANGQFLVIYKRLKFAHLI